MCRNCVLAIVFLFVVASNAERALAAGQRRFVANQTPLSQPTIMTAKEPRPTSTLAVESVVEAAAPLDIQVAAESPSLQQNAAPAYIPEETFPIDLETVVRLSWNNSTAIQFARARVREANARLDRANVQWLPDLAVGTLYNRFDGQTQNQRGDVFGVSRSNLASGLGPSLSLDTSEAIYAPLIERRLQNAAVSRLQAMTLVAGLESISAYMDLLSAHAMLEINKETTARAEAMYHAAQNAKEARLDRSAGDVNRSKAELLLRQLERQDLEARARIASARLVRLLMLSPTTQLVPADPTVTTIELIEPSVRLEDLIELAMSRRPDLAAQRQYVGASMQRVEKRATNHLYPKLVLANHSSVFGGGKGSDLGDFDGRNALTAQIYWEVENLGLGNRADVEIRRADLDEQRIRLSELSAQISAEVTEAASIAVAKYQSLALAEKSVAEASELYRITREGTLNVVENKNLFDALRPLQAIQLLNQSQVAYLQAVTEFNRAQFRLYAVTGNDFREVVPSE